MRCETRRADESFSLQSFPELRSDYYYALPSPGVVRQQTNSSKRKWFKIKCNNNKIKKRASAAALGQQNISSRKS